MNVDTVKQFNFNGYSKKNKSNIKKVLVVTGSVAAAGAIFTLGSKGVFGSKFQNLTQMTLNWFKSLFQKEDAVNVQKIQNNTPKNDAIDEGVQILHTIPSKQAKDLFSRADAIRQEMTSEAYCEEGIVELFSTLKYGVDNGIDISKEIIKVLNNVSKLEQNLTEYELLMQENNSLASKFGCGKLLCDISDKQIYLDLIQKANQIQELIEYDKQGAIIVSSELKALISSWN